MLVGRLIAYVLLIIALGAYVAWRLLLARKKRGRSSILVALLVLVLGLGLALATLGWAISPGIPGVIDYSGHRFAIGQGGQGGVSGPGQPIRCETVSQLRGRSAWPLSRVGYVTWIGFGSVTGLVGNFPRGHPVFTGPNPNEIFLGLSGNCYLGAVIS